MVTTPTLPAGSYVVNARANLIGGGGVSNSLICSVLDDAAQGITVVSGAMLPSR